MTLGAAGASVVTSRHHAEAATVANVGLAQAPKQISPESSGPPGQASTWSLFDSGCLWSKPRKHRHPRVAAVSEQSQIASERQPDPAAERQAEAAEVASTPPPADASVKERRKMARVARPRAHRHHRDVEAGAAYPGARSRPEATFNAFGHDDGRAVSRGLASAGGYGRRPFWSGDR
jgi:hypothetical protein